jgi:hypothetical protein
MVRPCSEPAGKASWVLGNQEKEHTMSGKHNGTVASVIGIDISVRTRST